MKASRLIVAGAVAALLPFTAVIAQNPTPDTATQPAQTTPAQGQGATFESLDTDSDGRISKTEAEANANVKAQFSRYDVNGDGFIERAEVGKANTTPPETPKQ
jgi:Ca2+-binding EF-hand superfamily protein